MTVSKTCSKCGSEKPLDRFRSYDNGYGLKHRSTCKDCRNQAARGTRTEESARYCRANRAKLKDKKKEYYHSNRERLKEYSSQYYADNKEEVNLKVVAKTYGISIEKAREMRTSPCAICGTTGEGQQKAMHVDHCHTTGEVRGTLCHHCNTALGLLQEDVERLDKMKEYINAYK